MLAAIAAAVSALSLASSAIDVPFVPQTDALCGGAAAAMVLRYWGDAHAEARQFASLIIRDRRGAAGIGSETLVGAVRARGWQVEQSESSVDALRTRLAARQPVIVLLAERRNRYHYVVVVDARDGAIIVHDPSWGPSRALDVAEFERRWSASRNWSAVVLPSEIRPATRAVTDAAVDVAAGSTGPSRHLAAGSTGPGLHLAAAAAVEDACADRLDAAIDRVRDLGLDRADEILNAVRAECPRSAGPLRELAGVRFVQRRWSDSAALARDALTRSPGDPYSLELLAASLFMQEDASGALRAWNQIGKPRLDVVKVTGVTRSRYQAITDALALTPGSMLTADAFLKATRRAEEYPGHAMARLDVRPEQDGFASVDVAIAERDAHPRGWIEWTGAAARAGIDREASVDIPGSTGQGEMWSAEWRWWSHRPRVAIGFAAPRVGNLFGVWRVEGSWEEETYATATSVARQSRGHAGLIVSDWATGNVRYTLESAFDTWDRRFRTASMGASIERRWLDDRAAVAASGTTWMPIGDGSRFTAVGIRGDFRTAVQPRRWVYRATVGTDYVTDAAPMMLWPGAGEGRARAPLLRAHPLLQGGIIQAENGTFGRSLQYSTTEIQRWLARPSLAKLGIALFADQARSHPATTNVDVGAGLRIRVSGLDGVLRIDAARGLRDGSNAMSLGWDLFGRRQTY